MASDARAKANPEGPRTYKEVVRFVDKLADDHRRAQKL